GVDGLASSDPLPAKKKMVPRISNETRAAAPTSLVVGDRPPTADLAEAPASRSRDDADGPDLSSPVSTGARTLGSGEASATPAGATGGGGGANSSRSMSPASPMSPSPAPVGESSSSPMSDDNAAMSIPRSRSDTPDDTAAFSGSSGTSSGSSNSEPLSSS